MIIKDFPCSRVWVEGSFVYKWQPKHLTDNDIWCLETVSRLGFAPQAVQIDLEVIKMEHIVQELPPDPDAFLHNIEGALFTLRFFGIRHGDLTRPNVLVRGNTPVLIDFSESRLASDPRPDKRPEGDAYWLRRTAGEILDECA